MRWIPAVLACAVLSTVAYCAADGFKVTTDRTVDSSSLESIVADAVRLSGAKTNDEKGIAIYNYLNQVLFHNSYPKENGPQSIGPLKMINVYGWGLCGGEHTVMKSLFETAGWPVRYRGWSSPGHTTVETQYDGKWHYFDVFLRAYYWTKDKKTIAGQDDIIADPSVALDGLKDGRVPQDSYLACGDDAPGIVQGCKNSKATGVFKHEQGWASVTGRDHNYSPLLRLPSGAALTLNWDGLPGEMVANGTKGIHTCGTKDFRNDPVLGPVFEHYGRRNYSNGAFVYAPDFSKAGDIADIELSNAKAAGGKLAANGAGSAIFKLALPYPYAKATLGAEFDGDGKLFISSNGGKSWQPAAAGDVSTLVRQHYDVYIKAEFTGALKSLKLDAVVEHNRGALPFLYNGKNAITVATKDNKLPANATLVVTYAYQEATAPAGKRRFEGKGVTYGETKTVSKEVTALPFTFEIEVGGNTPPKMVSYERAVKSK